MRAETRPPRSRRLSLAPLAEWLSQAWRLRWRGWLDRRIPPARGVTLNQGNLFVFPTRQGGGYLLMAALVWIGATNFQNNLVLGLCFLLLAIFFVAIHQTFANLSGLSLRFVSAEPVYAGSAAHCLIELASATDRQRIALGWPGAATSIASPMGRVPEPVRVMVTPPRRGRFRPGRCRVESRYPLGIIRCWTWLDLQVELLVYPQPIPHEGVLAADGALDDRGVPVTGAEDFFALRAYVPGDALGGVAWKHYAAGRGLLVREQVDYRGADLWLDYLALPDADPEIRLSKLCYSALELGALNRPYGLRLPGLRIEPAAGDGHLRQVLRALAECPV